MAKIGRNELCPCGSGKKYKKCCMKGPSEQARRLVSVDDVLERVTEWLVERFPQDFDHALESDFLALMSADAVEMLDEMPDDLRGLIAANAHEWALAEGWARPENGSTPLLKLVLGVGGPILEADQRVFLEKLEDTCLNLYEVLGVIPGQSVRVRELVSPDPSRGPETQWVYAPSLAGSELADQGTVLGLRVVPGSPPRATLATYFFPGSWTASVVNNLRKAIEINEHPEDLPFAFSATIIESWFALLTSRPPNLVDASSGDALLLVTDHYRVEDPEALAERLAAQPDVEVSDEDGWVRLREREDGSFTPLLSLYDGKREGTLEAFTRTSSLADEGRVWLREVAGDALTYVTREISDPMSMAEAKELRDSGAAASTEEDPTANFTPEQIGEIIGQHYRRMYADWTDVPIPALGDTSPRDAVKTAEGRQAVIDLLDSYDRNERRMAKEQGREALSFDFLREQVGLLD